MRSKEAHPTVRRAKRHNRPGQHSRQAPKNRRKKGLSPPENDQSGSGHPEPLCFLSRRNRPAGIPSHVRGYTKGSFTTSARSRRPRTSTAISVPAFANSGFTYPMPKPTFMQGDIVPEVTWPISAPSGAVSL